MFLRNVWLQLSLSRTMSYYAVAKGRKIGIYSSWQQCEEQITGFKGASYKKFKSRHEAEQFINSGPGSSTFSPQDLAVALGKKVPPPAEWKNINKAKKSSTDFWPENDDDDAFKDDNDLADDDLLSALAEVEGISTVNSSDSRKRKNGASNLNSLTKIPKHDSKILEAEAIKKIGAFDFLLDSEGYVIVYTDGSCFGNGRANACAGFGVYFGDDHPLNAAKPVQGRVTNNVGEIQAAIYAIKSAIDVGIPKLCISTDSQFLIKSITTWVSGWKKRNWRLKNNEPVKNVADFKELDELLQNNNILVKWNYVKAHKGIRGNEMADKLARKGSQLYTEQNKVK